MKLTIDFDKTRDYGNATHAIHQIIALWTDIDWFEPPKPGAAGRAIAHVDKHYRLAYSAQPELFPARIQCRVVNGQQPAFDELCERVKARSLQPNAWDWKYSALKMLSYRHSQNLGWSLDSQKIPMEQLPQEYERGGSLFFQFGERSIVWSFNPKFAADNGSPWYMSYANMDVIFCIEWHLAEKSSALEDNPFIHLLRCYAEGFLPFGMSKEEMLLFAFS